MTFRNPHFRRTTAALALGLCLGITTVACAEYDGDDASDTTEVSGSGDVASRDEFIAAVRESQSEMFTSNVEGMGLDAEKASEVYDEFIGCTYDEIKDTPELVERAMDPNAAADTELDAELQELATDCQDTFNADMRELLAEIEPTETTLSGQSSEGTVATPTTAAP